MKAVAVLPGKPDSVHLRDIPKPTLDDIPDGRGVLGNKVFVKVSGEP